MSHILGRKCMYSSNCYPILLHQFQSTQNVGWLHSNNIYFGNLCGAFGTNFFLMGNAMFLFWLKLMRFYPAQVHKHKHNIISVIQITCFSTAYNFRSHTKSILSNHKISGIIDVSIWFHRYQFNVSHKEILRLCVCVFFFFPCLNLLK